MYIIYVNNTLPLAHEISRHFWAAYGWTGQLDWTVGLDSWTGQLDWTIGLEFFSIKYMQFDVFEGNEMIIFKRLCFFL